MSPPPPPRSSPLKRASVTAIFLGLIAFAWVNGHRRSEASTEGGPTRFGFSMTESSIPMGVRFEHHATHVDPLLANIEPHVAGMGAAVSVADANGDGWADFYVTSSAFGTPNALFVNQKDGTFRDVAAQAGVADVNREGEGASMGSIWGDIDNDGREDLFIYKWGYPQLFHNDGDLHFTDVTERAGVRRWKNSNGAVWLDFDRDGLLDLYVAGYFRDDVDLWHVKTTEIMQESFEFANNGGHKVLYRNLGDGRFEDVTEAMGADSTRWTLAVASADFNQDGWPDLYLANDYGPEELFLNRGGKRFELATDVGLNETSKSGMSVAVGDVRGDGRLGVYVTNISKRGFLFQGNNLRVNRLDDMGRFVNMAEGDVADCGWAWGAQFGDFNNDGFADLFVANGFISASRDRDYWYDMSKIAGGSGNLFRDAKNWAPFGDLSLSGYERSRLLLNEHGAGFIDVAGSVGVTDVLDGRGVALADLSNGGALDVIVANQKAPVLVYKNRVDASSHWVQFALEGTKSNRSAIGAQITITFAGRTSVQVIDGGSGFCAQNQRRAHFGLGDAARVDRAVIRWPSGAAQTLENLAADRIHTIREER